MMICTRTIICLTFCITVEYLGDRADLLVVLNQPYITSISSPKFGKIDLKQVYQGSRQGDHKDPGLVFARGQTIEPGQLQEPISVLNLAPTIASLLGVALPDVDGTPIAALCGASERKVEHAAHRLKGFVG